MCRAVQTGDMGRGSGGCPPIGLPRIHLRLLKVMDRLRISPSPSPWLRRASWIVLGGLALALATPVQAGDDRPRLHTPAVPAPKPFGETQILRRCLVFIAKSYRDSQSDVENQD